MRIRVLTIALLAVACSPGDKGKKPAADPTATATVAPAPPPAALDAKKVAADYFAALKAGDYARAYRMWGNNGADSGGSLQTFRKSFAQYRRYEGAAGAPSEIRHSNGVDYVLVESLARTQADKGVAEELSGVLMLKRSASPGAIPGGWAIWGADIRDRHCKVGQSARGLGCS